MEHLPHMNVANLTLRELTREGGETALLQRLYYEVETTEWSREQKDRVKQVADLVVQIYHAGDMRDDNTYATHVLRVACRILSTQHFNLRESPQVIIAALLHDTVEDRPERLLDEDALNEHDMSDINLNDRIEQRHRALGVVEQEYGSTVAEMVDDVSNPIYDKTDLSMADRQDTYRTHVTAIMSSESSARYIKLSDFIDNCLGLEYNADARKRLRLAYKYKPLLPVMLEFVLASDIYEDMKNRITQELFMANELCNSIIADAPLNQAI